MSSIGVIYWSGSGNTKAMAEAVAEGIRAAGSEADLMEVSDITPDKAAEYEKLAFGCPSMGSEVLEESEFEPFFEAVEQKLSGKKVALFGSYGWGDGEWMRDWQERTEGKGADVFSEGLIRNETPDSEGLDTCREFGKNFAAY